ncbi:hypothetical protein EMCRGX_G018360 [Ephydatia muelleri]
MMHAGIELRMPFMLSSSETQVFSPTQDACCVTTCRCHTPCIAMKINVSSQWDHHSLQCVSCFHTGERPSHYLQCPVLDVRLVVLPMSQHWIVILQSSPQALHSNWNMVLGVISAAASLPSHVHVHQQGHLWQNYTYHLSSLPPPSLLPPFTFTSSLSLAPSDPPVHCDSNLLSMRRTALLGDSLILSRQLMTLSSVYLLIRSLTLTSPLAPQTPCASNSPLLVEHTAPNIHDSNKSIVWQIHVQEDSTAFEGGPYGGAYSHSPIPQLDQDVGMGSAEQDALTMKESPLKNLILFFLRPHPSWG